MPPITRVTDAYRALELLANHPLIDPNKIAVMGFSRGGVPALYASMLRFQKMYGNANIQFAAYITVYGSCGTTYQGDEALAARPVLLLHGTADDFVPIEPCRAYVARLIKEGMNARLIEYPDAQHTFDDEHRWHPGKQGAMFLLHGVERVQRVEVQSARSERRSVSSKITLPTTNGSATWRPLQGCK